MLPRRCNCRSLILDVLSTTVLSKASALTSPHFMSTNDNVGNPGPSGIFVFVTLRFVGVALRITSDSPEGPSADSLLLESSVVVRFEVSLVLALGVLLLLLDFGSLEPSVTGHTDDDRDLRRSLHSSP